MSLSVKGIFFLLLLWIGSHPPELAGQGQNPFEIRSRAPLPDTASRVDSTVQTILPDNPFELRPSAIEAAEINRSDGPSRWLRWVREEENGSIQKQDIQSLLFWALLFLSFLLAIALNINRSVTLKLYRSLVNLNFLSLLYRESKEENLLIYYLLYGLYFIGISLFIYLSINHFYGTRDPIYILYVAVFVLASYGLRHLSLKLIGSIYGIYREADRYLFSIVIFGCIMSILLIPADFIITFVNPAIARKAIVFISILFILMYLYRQFREIIFSVNLWRNHIVHFFLYLCTFEIAPLVLFWIYLNRQGVV